MLTLCFFWSFNALHWWGVFEFGIQYTAQFTIYSICIFVSTCFMGACMLMSGSGSNKSKRKYEFLRARVFECKARDMEEAEKKKQAYIYRQQKLKEAMAQKVRDEQDRLNRERGTVNPRLL